MKALVLTTDKVLYRNLLECAAQAGIGRIVVIGTADLAFVSHSIRCLEFFRVSNKDFASPSLIIDLVQRAQKRYQCDILIPACMTTTYFVANNKRSLATLINLLPTAESKLLVQLHDKWQFYLLCKELGLQIPKTRLILPAEANGEAINCVPESINDLDFPVILKPLESNGGNGQVTLHNQDEFDAILQTLWVQPLLVQEYIAGYDVSLSTLSNGGELLEAYLVRKIANRAVELVENPEVLRIAKEVIQNTGFTGIGNFDFRIDAQQRIYLLECNPRIHGNLHCFAYIGLNLLDSTIRLAQGKPLSNKAASGARYLYRKQLLRNLGRLDSDDLRQLVTKDVRFFLYDPIFCAMRLFGL